MGHDYIEKPTQLAFDQQRECSRYVGWNAGGFDPSMCELLWSNGLCSRSFGGLKLFQQVQNNCFVKQNNILQFDFQS